MPLTFVSCPYCNASMPLSDADSARMTCVRCGESFPVRNPAETNGPSAPAGTALAPAPVEVKRRNRRIGLIVILVMAAMFLAALFFALETRGKRTGSLAESPALGFLPADTNVIAAVNVPVADAARKERKGGDEPDFVDRLFFASNAAINVEEMTGLKRSDVEEIMLGLRVDNNVIIPKVRLIVRTRSSYDAGELRERLGAYRSKQEGAKQIDVIRPRGVPREAVLWCATAKTFVITLTPEDMQLVPDEPAKNIERLAPQLVDLMRFRPEKETFFWLMGHNENWEKTPLALIIGNLTPEERKKLFKLQTFAVAMRLDSGAVTTRARPARITEQVDPANRGFAVDLALKSASEEDAIELRDLFERWLKSQQLVMRGNNRDGTLYTATVSGTPEEWDTTFKAVRNAFSFR